MSADDKHGYFDPSFGVISGKCPYKSGSLTHHAFASLRDDFDQQVELFCQLILKKKRLRMGVSTIRLSFDVDGRKDSIGRGVHEYMSHVPMTCFTDVHPTFADYHAKVYGKLGIVFSSSSLIKLHPHPVKYVWPRSRTVDSKSAFINDYYAELYDSPFHVAAELQRQGQEELAANLVISICSQLAYCQQIVEPLTTDSRQIPQNYFYGAENEWRIVDLLQLREFLTVGSAQRDKIADDYLSRDPLTGYIGSSPYIDLLPYQMKHIFVPEERYVKKVRKKLADIGWGDFDDVVIAFDDYVSIAV